MKLSRRSWIVVVLTLAFVAPLTHLIAQSGGAAKRPLDIEDVIAFRGLGATVLSPNGQWLAYRMSPTQGDSEVIVKNTGSDKEIKLAVGEGAGGVMTFSEDGQWLALSTAATKTQADAARRAARPAAQAGMTLVELATGKKTDIAKIRRFAFNNEAGGWIALHRFGADTPGAAGAAGAAGAGRAGAAGRGGAGAGTAGDTRAKGTDLVLHDLKSGAQINIGNVSEFAFNKSGRTLAMIIDAADQAGNGVQARDMTSGVVTPLDTDKAFYERLAFTEDGDALSVLKGHDEITAWKDRMFAVTGWTGLNAGISSAKKVSYDPAKDTAFPAGMSISNNRTPAWTENRDAILFGIAKINKADAPAGRGRGAAPDGVDAPAPPAGAGASAADAADRPNLVVWHYKDPRLQSAQQVQEAGDRSFSYLSTYRVAENKFVRLADDDVRQVTVGPKEKFGIGSDVRAYELQSNLDGRSFRDIYAINMATGARTPVLKQARYAYQISPDGTKFYYYEGKHYFVIDLANPTPKNVTLTVPTSFVDVENDHNTVTPPIFPVGWTADSASLILSDGWDMWNVSTDGSSATNLTINGKKNQIRYRQRLRIDPEEKGIDLKKPQYIGMMDQWTKKQGVGILAPGKTGVELLIYDDASFNRLSKAKNADTWIFSKETSSTPPEIFATNSSLSAPRKLTNTAAEVEPYDYTGGRILVDFFNDKKDKANPKGERLQGTLYLPANYVKGKTYPTIVYIYERLTQGTNNFARPSVPGGGFNRAYYMSNGYAVYEPDIKYYINDPGMSAVWALVPAVKAAIATGVVDPARVALQGHSWGGYQTAFTITQTDIFKAASAGAPLTNMISMYGLLYKNSGGTNGAIFEASQGRFTSGPWDNWNAYTRNSPIAFAKNVKTPLLMLHNDADGAVDFTQGIEYFNTLRRLGKSVILIEYPGENHGLARQPNMQDYMIRMKEFFDAHLMGKPAPAWMEDGIPRLKMSDDVTERLKAREEATKKKAADAIKKGGN